MEKYALDLRGYGDRERSKLYDLAQKFCFELFLTNKPRVYEMMWELDIEPSELLGIEVLKYDVYIFRQNL